MMENQCDVRLDGLRILVVDDAADNRLLVSRFLKLAGAQTDLAGDGPQGIVLALSCDFDLVLMDIQMPGMDGYEAVNRLREHQFKNPIIALTAHAMRSERERCLSSGFDAYLTKPISRTELLRTIRTFADRTKRENSESIRPADTLPDPDSQLVRPVAHRTPDHNPH